MPLLFSNWKVSYLNLIQTNFNFLAEPAEETAWFESRFEQNPQDRFSHVEAHLSAVKLIAKIKIFLGHKSIKICKFSLKATYKI